jgi:hypothetical protein
VAAKLFWDADCDVDALLTDFYQSFFGPAAEPMGRYFTRMDAALRDGDHHAGCSYALPLLYPPPLRDASRADLEEAARLAAVGQSVRLPPAGRQTNSLRYAGGRTNSLRYAGETVYGQRVAMFRLTFDALEEFLTMLDRRNAFDFVAAQAALDRLRALQEQAVAHDPPLLNPRAAGSYLQRFWSQATEQGHERTIGGSRAAAETAALQNGAAAETAALQNNEFVAGLPDRWAFLLDPFQVGEDLGYHRPRLYGGNWQSLATVSATWSDQGLHYYKGDAWYRAAVEVPARFAGRKILLWFGGVDERAKVWVNGELLGESDGRAFVPFEFDATAAVHCGQANEVVVRVTNNSLDEIGTGGITAPVMFWSPGKG